jgi:hypothetical protein
VGRNGRELPNYNEERLAEEVWVDEEMEAAGMTAELTLEDEESIEMVLDSRRMEGAGE